ncbi:MAG: diguanylate cyclase [Kofleriaceae bacterium]|nr:diguanylate cyclase [Myxococcales bacterium]MCB9558800.1 diguanylate cyclase [Kofleriaceae bacterium]MCB9570646.1 diguanylate cyclase [Kofleriaceae bacterium]
MPAAPPRILLVEDDPRDRAALCARLAAEGFEVVTAEEPAQVVAELERACPALVISELRTPRLDGGSVIAWLRRRDPLAEVPIIVVSADGGAAVALHLGADDHVRSPVDPDELVARVHLHLRQARRLRDLARRASIDALTGVLNRRGIHAVLRRERLRALRAGGPLSILAVDVNRLKHVNDTHGHPVGDALLRQVAHDLTTNLRLADRLGRVGGDEFTIVVPDASLAGAQVLADRLRGLRWRADGPGGTMEPVGVAVGAAVLEGTESSLALIARADQAMYADKRARS